MNQLDFNDDDPAIKHLDTINSGSAMSLQPTEQAGVAMAVSE